MNEASIKHLQIGVSTTIYIFNLNGLSYTLLCRKSMKYAESPGEWSQSNERLEYQTPKTRLDKLY